MPGSFFLSTLKRKAALVVVAALCFPLLQAQDGSGPARLFPSGQPILKIFANYHSGISGASEHSAFELERAYIGYQLDFEKSFRMKIVLDVGSPDDVSEFSKIRRYAYFKNASLSYQHSFLTLGFGLIDMRHFKLQEEFWGHRYIEKSFADRFRFGPSADLGLEAVFNIRSKVKIDFTVSNGEGYTNLQRDNTLKAGLGIEAEVFKGFFMRAYSDLMMKEVAESAGVVFAGYRFKDRAVAGAEYNWKLNEGYRDGYNRRGYSVYASCKIPFDLELFGRYDFVRSGIPEGDDRPWDLARDGSSIIGGIQYKPISRISLALSYRDWFPYAKNLENKYFIYLYLEAKY
jgi:hypothetical protein